MCFLSSCYQFFLLFANSAQSNAWNQTVDWSYFLIKLVTCNNNQITFNLLFYFSVQLAYLYLKAVIFFSIEWLPKVDIEDEKKKKPMVVSRFFL